MFSSLTIVPATPEQAIVSRKRTYVEWGKGLTQDEYLERDAIGETMEFGKDDRLMTWYVTLKLVQK
jgi:hypothetical protein